MKVLAPVLVFVLVWSLAGCVDYSSKSSDAGLDGDGSPVEDGDGGPWDDGDDGFDGWQDGDGGGDHPAADCEPFISALVDCPYQYQTELRPHSCPVAQCMDRPCREDKDCSLAGATENGDKCVLGNCVYCWQDSDCDAQAGSVCRAGRCVDQAANPCDNNPPCEDSGCSVVSLSEQPCPVCVCDSFFQLPCTTDEDCMPISSHRYFHCVYGRCAECRDDTECDYGSCLPPGLCFDMQPHPQVLCGTWLIGWHGGLDHFSYFRFEPDGILRRGFYGEGGAWADDIPMMPCWPDGVIANPLIGTWEPEITSSGFLVVRMNLNIHCDEGAGWSTRYAVSFELDGRSASFQHVDGDEHYLAYRKPWDACSPDMAICEVPTYPP